VSEPELCSLPLQQLQHLTALGISLVLGDVPAGQQLSLPCQLQRLQVSATTLSLAINVLPIQQLHHLTSLRLSVMDSKQYQITAPAAGPDSPPGTCPLAAFGWCRMYCTASPACKV